MVDKNEKMLYNVRYAYEGDALSDYETNCMVVANSEKEALEKAKKNVRNINAWNFRIDWPKPMAYSEFKKKYPGSNMQIIESSLHSLIEQAKQTSEDIDDSSDSIFFEEPEEKETDEQ